MLQTNELDDVKSVLKSYLKYGYANQAAMDTDLTFVATQVELKFKDSNLVGQAQYDYIKGLAGVYPIIDYNYLYWAEVYAIARDFVNHAVSKNMKNASGYSFSLPDYSESVQGNQWFVNDINTLQTQYIQFMYSAGYKVNSVKI